MPKPRKPKHPRSRRPREVTDGAILAAVQKCAMEDVENGSFDTALVWAENAVEHLETKGEPFVLANALQLLSFILGQLGRHHEAIEQAQRSRAIFVDLGELHWVADCDSFIAFNLHKLGKSLESNAKLESARAIYSSQEIQPRPRCCLRWETFGPGSGGRDESEHVVRSRG